MLVAVLSPDWRESSHYEYSPIQATLPEFDVRLIVSLHLANASL